MGKVGMCNNCHILIADPKLFPCPANGEKCGCGLFNEHIYCYVCEKETLFIPIDKL